MTKITSDLLNDTLNLVQLARETALARGNKDQAGRLTPVADNLRELASTARQPKAAEPKSGILGQSDFQTLLSVVQSKPENKVAASNPTERNQVISAMSEAGMTDIDIARHMGMTRDEINLVLNIGKSQKSSQNSSQVIK